MTDDVVERSRDLFAAEDFKGSYEMAVDGLRDAPDDVELRLVAGNAGVEIEARDAVDHLRRATELAGDDARTWRALGEALVTEGDTSAANDAFSRAVELDPEDRAALTQLGHTSVAVGRGAEGLSYLARAAAGLAGASSASISLVDMYRSMGENDKALEQARRLADAAPDDALAQLDVAELSLAVGQFDQAYIAFSALRDIDDVPGHEAYPLHGMIRVEITRENWRPALELARQARAIDPQGLSTSLEAFLLAQTGGGDVGDEPVPDRTALEGALDASLAEYRRMHAEDRHVNSGTILG
jgi:Flp pilus assembly protein TadD